MFFLVTWKYQKDQIKNNRELDMVFVKHSAPNHMLAPILHIQPKALKITIDIKLIELKERKYRKLGGGGWILTNSPLRLKEHCRFIQIAKYILAHLQNI